MILYQGNSSTGNKSVPCSLFTILSNTRGRHLKRYSITTITLPYDFALRITLLFCIEQLLLLEVKALNIRTCYHFLQLSLCVTASIHYRFLGKTFKSEYTIFLFGSNKINIPEITKKSFRQHVETKNFVLAIIINRGEEGTIATRYNITAITLRYILVLSHNR